DAGAAESELGALGREDAVELVGRVLARAGLAPASADPGCTPQEITDRVEAVNGHARALVLLAPELARRGVKATTADLRVVMADLERRHPGDRENSLYASVELSLRKLRPGSRERVQSLAVCQGGVQLDVLAMMVGLEIGEARALALELIGVGLGEDMGSGHLRLDPGLPPYLLGQMGPEEADAARDRWAEAMAQLTGALYQQRSKDAKLSAHLTRLELPNLLGMLDWLDSRRPAEALVNLAGAVERLVHHLGLPHALERAARAREKAAESLGDWGHARCLTEDSNIERLLRRRDLPAATAAARALVERCLAAGDLAYPKAAYDSAMAHIILGRALSIGRAAEEALTPIGEAQERFQRLADAGDADAQGMVSRCITERADCLFDLGRLDEAASAYEESIRRDAARGNRRSVALGKSRLGTVRGEQGRHAEAIAAHVEARDTFAALGEPLTVATAWHQIGIAYHQGRQFDRAEDAYRESLAIKVREKDLPGEASTLHQLSSLYDAMDRVEEAITFARKACDLYVRLGDRAKEGVARSNLGNRLIRQRRHDDARQELRRAIECMAGLGIAGLPWKTWSLLADVERATGHAEAAAEARQRVIETYGAYRRAGGVSQQPSAQLVALVAQAIRANDQAEAGGQLAQLASQPYAPRWLQALVPKLQAILAGDRDPTLAADPALDYDDAVELQLLLDALAAG
ncbi:MAG: tetratricopeptide repeat protein, partial [Planctomycetes bacterium]|nr:tetratricopeptide repeat protein [Planctomycetota bacterium]